MARRPARRLLAVLTGLVLTACSTSGATTTTTTTTTTTIHATTSSRPTPNTTTTVPPVTASPGDEIDAEVVVPDGDGPFPAVVLVHGGGWVTGGPVIMEPLGDYLADQGYLIVNTRYALATMDRAAFPEAVEDVACAVRYAAGHADSDGTVAVIGHSAGAHIGAVVALTGDDYRGDCGFPGSGLPERFIGLAGPYDVSRLGLAIAAFFGGGPEVLPDAWQAGNPQLLTGENTDLESLIMYGELDRLVPETFAVDFHEALVEAGSVSTIELVEGARHNDVHVPDLVGELIATWLRRSNP